MLLSASRNAEFDSNKQNANFAHELQSARGVDGGLFEIFFKM